MSILSLLPTQDLSAADIRDTIGCPSNNLSHYCVKSKSGGIEGYAFQIIENGYTKDDGYLIQDAEPYFNIYSNEAPGEWVLLTKSSGWPRKELKYRLKRNEFGDITVGQYLFTDQSYCFNLGAFAGYVHNSYGVQLHNSYDDTLPRHETSTHINEYTFFFIIGDYDWSKVSNESLSVKMVLESLGEEVAVIEKDIDSYYDTVYSISAQSNVMGDTAVLSVFFCENGEEVAYFYGIEPITFTVQESGYEERYSIGNVYVTDNYGNLITDSYTIFVTAGVYDDDQFNVTINLFEDFGNNSRLFNIKSNKQGTAFYMDAGDYTCTNLNTYYSFTGLYTFTELDSSNVIDVYIHQL
ncbi:MAG: hypothetical protein R3Y04_08895 [Rikenellaceae bacterium]